MTFPGKSLYLLISLIIIHLTSIKIEAQEDGLRFNLSNSTVFSPGNNITVDLYSTLQGETVYHFKLFRITDYDNFINTANLLNRESNYDIFGKNGNDILAFTKLVKEGDAAVNSSHENKNLNIGRIDDTGDYILQVVKDSSVAYCGISVSNLMMVYKEGGGQVLAYVADNKTGKIVKDVKFKIFNKEGVVTNAAADKEGVLFYKGDAKAKAGSAIILAVSGKEHILSSPYFYSGSGQNNYIGYTYTNQPVYRPGQHVYFKSIFRDRQDGALANLPGIKYIVSIRSPKYIEIYKDTLESNEFGTISGDFILDDDAELGSYSITITAHNQFYYSSFSVEEYKKPEYLVKVETEKPSFAYNDTLEANISADYYFGSPLTGGSVHLKIFKQNIWHPWWFGSNFAWYYKGLEGRNINNGTLLTDLYGELDKNGKYLLKYPINGDTKADYDYTIIAEVTDRSRNQVTGTARVKVTRGSFSLSTSPVKNYSSTGSLMNIRVNAYDFSDKPVSVNFMAAFVYPEQKQDDGTYFRPVSDTLSGKTDSSGRAEIAFLPRGFFKGSYSYTIIAYDEKNRKITSEGSFYIGDYEAFRNGGNPEIITDKESYILGDTLRASVSLPEGGTDALISYEKNSFLGYQVKHTDSKKIEFSLKLNDTSYSPGFKIAIVYSKDGEVYNYSKEINVLDKSRFLNITLKPSAKTFKPGSKAEYKVLVTDNSGRPVPNTELSFGIIDESIYAIKEDPAQDIKSFFYSPGQYYINANNSRKNSSSFGASRYITLIDKFTNNKNLSLPGSSLINGTLKGQASFIDYNHLYVFLNNDKYFYKVKADDKGKFNFKNIQNGEYRIFVLLNYGGLYDAGIVSTSNGSNVDIFLSNFENQRYMPMMSGSLRFNSSVVSQEVIISNQMMRKSSDELVMPELRSNFVDAVIWKAHIVTDSIGEADISFTMPDNLTTWRATVRGITRDSKVGQNTDKTITRKNLLVRLETPRFFREGDEITVSTIVHNYLSEGKKVKVNFNAKGLDVLGLSAGQKGITLSGGNNSCDIFVDKDSEVRLDWMIKVSEPKGTAKLTAEALTNEESDALTINIPIQPAGVKSTESMISDITGSGTSEQELNIPSSVNLKTAKLSLSAAPSLAGTILKALDDLAGYPYGCVEQTMSRFLPTLITAKAFKEINAPLKSRTISELPKMIKAGLNRLYNLQHGDGGWGWWSDDETLPYMTAYVVYGMSLAKAAGYDVDEGSFERGVNNLKEQIINTGGLDYTTKAFMLYALSSADIAGKNIKDNTPADIARQLSDKRLNSYATAMLALTYNNLRDIENMEAALSRLANSVDEEKTFAYWPGIKRNYTWQNDEVQSTAFAVKALTLDGKYSGLVNKAVRWLLKQRQGFSWRSTQETASVIFGLTDYLKTTNELNPDLTASVFVNDKKVFEKHFTKDDVYDNIPPVTLDGLSSNDLEHGTNKIKIVTSGVGKLYFSGAGSYFIKDKPDADSRFNITRNYFILNPVDMGNKIVYEKLPFNGEVKSGQIIYVQTKVESSEKDLQYFILEDKLPSGFEAVKDESNYEMQQYKGNTTYDRGYSPIINYSFSNKEYHDDRVSFFVANTAEKMEFNYMMRAQTPGKVSVNPSQGYLMYYPEFGGASKAININVTE